MAKNGSRVVKNGTSTICYRWPQKKDPHQFSDFFENFSGSNDRSCKFVSEGCY